MSSGCQTAQAADFLRIPSDFAETRYSRGVQTHDVYATASPTTDATPVFSTGQNLDFEDSVIVGRWKFLEKEEGDDQRLYDLELDPMETRDRFSENPNVARCLAATLHQFRNNQLAFYSNRALKTQYFPPQYSLARDPACKAVFGN